MRKFLAVLMATAALGIVSVDAEAAKRLGGGSSIGKQRQAISPQQAAPKAPAQQQQAAPNTPPAQQPAPSGASKWLGPLAGLALGAGLASLFMNNGLAGALGGILMMLAIAAAVFFVIRMLRARSQPQPLRYAGAGAPHQEPVVGSGYGNEPVMRETLQQPAANPAAAPHSVAATLGSAPATREWPAGFDAAQFVRHAKLNFVDLQAANDARDFAALREMLTPELYRDIEASIKARGDAPQQVEVMTLNAEVLDVAEEGDLYVVTVRFTGTLREDAAGPTESFSELWHLEKPVRGKSGWLVAGIQQA